MKTKRITYYVDLRPGWQDDGNYGPYLNRQPYERLEDGYRRFAIAVELPVFGGTALAEAEIQASEPVEITTPTATK